METIELLSQYLSSPIILHRNRAIEVFVKEAITNPEAIKQLKINMSSKDYDILVGSLKVILALVMRKPRNVSFYKDIFNLGKSSEHYEVVFLCKKILAKLDDRHEFIDYITDKLTPNYIIFNSEERFYANCDYSLKFLLGSDHNKYELSRICEVFRYDGKKAFRKVKYYMKQLGYNERKKYRGERPERWKYDYYNNYYETRLHYYSRHAIMLFLLWCIKNMSTSIESWSEYVNRKKWDASLPNILIEAQPAFLKFKDINMDTDLWIRKRIKKDEAYELFDAENKWFPLVEYTHLKGENKSINRDIKTCFIRKPIGYISRKVELSIEYSGSDCTISELPIDAYNKGLISIDEYNHNDYLENKLLPTYGRMIDDDQEYIKIYPTPELINHFKLKQKRNSLEYFKGKELVIRCINWESGYHANYDNQGEEKITVSNYGYLLIIKTKYLKRYIKEKKLKLIAYGSMSKEKTKAYGYKYEPKNSKYKKLSLKIVNL